MRSFILALSVGVLLTNMAVAQPSSGFVTGTQPSSDRASNLPGQANQGGFSPSLPAPPVQGNLPSDFLQAAERALAAGRTGEAQQAMEMAQTRMLDRSVPLGQTNVPSDNPTVGQISMALQSLGAHDRAATMRNIEAAIASAKAQGQ